MSKIIGVTVGTTIDPKILKGTVQPQITQNAENISRNSKRITNLERGLVPDPFETDDSVAYMKDVPSTALPYAEIQKVGGMTVKDEETGALESAPVTEVVSVGSNLIPFQGIPNEFTSAGVTYVKQADGGIKVNGTASTTSRCLLAIFKPMDLPAGTYYVSVAPICSARALVDGYYGSSWKKTLRTGDGTVTVDWDGYTEIRVMLYVYEGEQVSNVTVYEMLNKGPAALPFRPYTKNTLPIPEAVQTSDGYGDGVNGSVHNYIDLENKKFVKQVGKVDLGTIVWYWGSNTSCNAGYANRFKPNAKIICVVPSPFGRAYIDAEGVLVVTYTANSFATAAEVKAALSGVMLYYELATPEITDISDLITADNFIEVEPNGTITFENEHKYDVPSTVLYQLKGASV
jgi:hypothetical protein